MTTPNHTWMLAFDATCCTCHKMSIVVQESCNDRLSVVPLDRSDIVSLRTRALGPNPPHTPTLLRAGDGARVRAWTGAAIAVPLARRLGVRDGLRVTRALGAAARPAEEPRTTQAGMSRQRFLQLGAGAGVAAGLLVFGRKPSAFATPAEQKVSRWVTENRAKLPTRYSDVVNRPMPYRQAILQNSSPAVQSRLWLDHLAAQRASLGTLPSAQSSALHRAEAVFSRTEIFGTGRAPTPAVHATLESLRTTTEAAFGVPSARQLLATFGPADPAGAPAASWVPTGEPIPACQCTSESDYCGSGAYCGGLYQCTDHFGCGTGNLYDCNGTCMT